MLSLSDKIAIGSAVVSTLLALIAWLVPGEKAREKGKLLGGTLFFLVLVGLGWKFGLLARLWAYLCQPVVWPLWALIVLGVGCVLVAVLTGRVSTRLSERRRSQAVPPDSPSSGERSAVEAAASAQSEPTPKPPAKKPSIYPSHFDFKGTRWLVDNQTGDVNETPLCCKCLMEMRKHLLTLGPRYSQSYTDRYVCRECGLLLDWRRANGPITEEIAARIKAELRKAGVLKSGTEG